MFVDDADYKDMHGHIYSKCGIDPERGAVVIVRPDQCMCKMFLAWAGISRLTVYPDVSKVCALDDFEGVSSFFKGFLRRPPLALNGSKA